MKMSKAATILAVALALVVLLVPMTQTSGDSVANASINLPDDQSVVQGPAEVKVDSEHSATLTYFLINNSNSLVYLQMNSMTLQKGNVEISSTLTDIQGDETRFIREKPDASGGSSDSDAQNIAILTITVTADRYADAVDLSEIFSIVGQYVGGDRDDDPIALQFQLKINVDSVFYSEDAYNKFFGLIPNNLDAPFNNPWFTAAATLVIWVLMSIVVCYIIIPLLTRLAGNRKDAGEKRTIKRTMTEGITLIMLIVAINECAAIVGAGSEIISFIGSVSNIFYVGIGAVIAWKAYVFIVTTVLNGLDEGMDVDGIDMSLLPLFKLIGKLLISVAAVTLMLAAFGVDLAGILVSAGVVSLGITFGAQEIISQFFSGIVLLSTRPFEKGDFVKIDSDTYCVHRVRLMFTEFENWDRDQIVTMPNNKVTSATMVNYTRGNKLTRIFIYVSVAYDADLSKAKELMLQAAKTHPHTVCDGRAPIPPGVRLTDFADSGIEYRLAVFVDDFDNSAHYAGQIREIIYKLFKDNDIEIPYNRMDVSFRSPLDATIRRPGDNEPDE